MGVGGGVGSATLQAGGRGALCRPFAPEHLEGEAGLERLAATLPREEWGSRGPMPRLVGGGVLPDGRAAAAAPREGEARRCTSTNGSSFVVFGAGVSLSCNANTGWFRLHGTLCCCCCSSAELWAWSSNKGRSGRGGL